jgi:hypothetical protein
VVSPKFQAHQRTRQEEQQLRRESLVRRAEGLQDDLIRHLDGLLVTGMQLAKLYAEWPKGLRFPTTARFPKALERAKAVLDRLWAAMYPSKDRPPDAGTRKKDRPPSAIER